MATITKGSFALNLGVVRLGGDLSDDDRQCAWELYTELVTRAAVVGKPDTEGAELFDGEIYIESLNSLYSFFQEARKIMRKFPVGRLSATSENHLGCLINRMMLDVMRPFLEKWQARYRHWWEHQSDKRQAPFVRQQEYPELQEFLDDWSDVRQIMRQLAETLKNEYKLVPVDS